MVAPNLLPGRTFDQSKLNSKLLLYWRAQDRSLVTVGSDSTGTLVRASAGGLTEGRGHFRPSSTSDVRLVGPVADNQPRWGVTAARKPYLLLEAARTNAWSHSSQLNNVAWNKTRSSITPNAILAPDGQITADKLVEDGSPNTTHYIKFQAGTGTIAINTDQTLSFYVKAAERTWLELRDNLDSTRQSWINLTTGVVGTKHADHTITITDANLPGWWRITLVVDSGPSTSGNFTILLATGDNGATYSGDGSSGFYLWGMQFEANKSFASSHIVTAGSAVTRATESLVFPFLAPPQEMTVYCKFVERGTVKLINQRLWSIGNASPSLAVHFSNGYIAQHLSSGEVLINSTVTPSLDDMVEVRVILHANGSVTIGLSVNGGTETVEGPSAPTPGGLAAAWSQELFYANSYGSIFTGFSAPVEIKIESGTKTLAQMREAL